MPMYHSESADPDPLHLSFMTTRGAAETTALRANIESQLNRLLSQLQDLEDMRSVMTPLPL